MNFLFILHLEVLKLLVVMMYTIECLVEFVANAYAASLKAVSAGLI